MGWLAPIHKLKNGNWPHYTGGKWGIGPTTQVGDGGLGPKQVRPCHKLSCPLSTGITQVDLGTMVALFPVVVG